MATINNNSILKKARAVMSSTKIQSQIEQIKDNAIILGNGVTASGKRVYVKDVRSAAKAFISVLTSEINSHAGSSYANGDLGNTAISALTSINCGNPVKVGKNQYQIGISFSSNLHRDSLAPEKYGGVDNIVALLNNGYTARHTVFGQWHGKDTQSLTVRAGANFVSSAVNKFLSSYSDKYNVTGIRVNNVFK